MEYKGYLIRAVKQFPQLVDIQVAGRGGKIPVVLQSMYTKAELAKQAIDNYLNGKK